ncbi:MAG: methyltransferase domain-containing protein [Alphaproteobacteria bacterium]|nr:methyltransferase domain-containing protein [Alphaproteobacteria bacterium]
MWFKELLIIIVLILGFAAAIYIVYQMYSFVRCGCGKYGPFVSSYGKLKKDILDEARSILKQSKKTLKVTDLGCGSGALLLPLAKEFPQHEFIGWEWDIVPLTMGKIKAFFLGTKNIKFIKHNYMTVSHKDMDLIMCYILKVTGEPLGKKLAGEIKDSAIVISEMFPLGHLEEIKQVQSSLGGVSEKFFVYKKPTKEQTKKESTAKSVKTPKRKTTKSTEKGSTEKKKTSKSTKKVAKTTKAAK